MDSFLAEILGVASADKSLVTKVLSLSYSKPSSKIQPAEKRCDLSLSKTQWKKKNIWMWTNGTSVSVV